MQGELTKARDVGLGLDLFHHSPDFGHGAQRSHPLAGEEVCVAEVASALQPAALRWVGAA